MIPRSTPDDSAPLGPDMVYVLPLPVCPYAMKHTLYPSQTHRINALHSSYIPPCVEFESKTRSKLNALRSGLPRLSCVHTAIPCDAALPPSEPSPETSTTSFSAPSAEGRCGRTLQNTRMDPFKS